MMGNSGPPGPKGPAGFPGIPGMGGALLLKAMQHQRYLFRPAWSQGSQSKSSTPKCYQGGSNVIDLQGYPGKMGEKGQMGHPGEPGDHVWAWPTPESPMFPTGSILGCPWSPRPSRRDGKCISGT